MRLTFISLFFVTTIALTGCKEPEATAPPVTPSVKFEEVGATSGNRIRQISGVLESSNRSELSFQVSGQVEEVLVNLGDRVTQGQILASLSTKDYQLTLSSRQAKLRNARANLSEKQEDYNRDGVVDWQKRYVHDEAGLRIYDETDSRWFDGVSEQRWDKIEKLASEAIAHT